jgi:hypothetical protein
MNGPRPGCPTADGEPIAEHLEQLRREAAALLQIPSPR